MKMKESKMEKAIAYPDLIWRENNKFHPKQGRNTCRHTHVFRKFLSRKVNEALKHMSIEQAA
jgi:hypothetical protein